MLHLNISKHFQTVISPKIGNVDFVKGDDTIKDLSHCIKLTYLIINIQLRLTISL